MSEVRLIGESTDQSGPYVDDWFLCLVAPHHWYELSVYSDGFQDFLKALSAYLGEELELKLYNSADFKSRILWPSSVRGEPLFDYELQCWRLRVGQTYSEVTLRVLHG